ncbi:hypothetical protein F5X96DRAFT_656456 [Biscogniauxia mediterranea]|nr:hypothetical protein F5X96DRAFT_656456 [Biscogniauxia mediterranea]
MWNMGHTNQSYDDSVIQQLHMTSSEGLPSTLVPDDSFYTSQNLPPGHQGSSYAPYSAAASSTPGASDRLSGVHSQPRAFYRVQSNPLYLPNEYNSSEPDLRSSGATPFMPSRAGSFDSSAHQSVTTETGYTNQAPDAYGYMYSHNQGHPGGLASNTPAPSPPTGPHGKKHKSVPRPRKGRHHPHHQGFSPEGSASPATPATTTLTTASVSSSAAAGGGGGVAAAGSGGGKSKLRSASRTSKNTHHNPPASAEERRSRETHNNVEKQYRNRLNAHFENLLNALPESMQCGEGVDGVGGGVGGGVGESLDSSDRRVSKAEVLDMARRHIKALERECAMLEGERDELRDNMEKLRWLFGRCEGGVGSAEGSGYLDHPGTIP